MFKNHWHIFAIATLMSMMTKVHGSYLFFILFVVWLLYLFHMQRITIFLLVIAVGSYLFFLFYIPSVHFSTDTAITNSKETTTFTGKVSSSVTKTDHKIEFTMYEEVSGKRVLVSFFIKEKNDIDHRSLRQVQYGATCQITGLLSNPDTATNPYQFDYEQYLLKQGISSQFIVTSLSDITCNSQSSILNKLFVLRETLLEKANEKLQKETAAWQQALVLGNVSAMDREDVELFQRWGLSHLIAISGLHVGIIVALIYIFLVRFSLVTKEKAQWVMIAFLPIYAILAGGQPSVWRASLMGLFVILFSIRKTKVSSTDLISIVFLVLIMMNKWIIYHVGFQFSFAVTFGLLLSSTWIKEAHSNIERLFQISFISQMIIVPLQMHYFYHFQPLSILLNVVIVPYFSLFVIPAMFVGLFLLYLPKDFLRLFENIFITIHHFVMDILWWIDTNLNFPFLSGDTSLFFMSVYYFLFIRFMTQIEKRNKRQAIQYGVSISLLLTILVVRPYFSPTGTVTMLDIGQGDAFIIELPYRKGVFLVDAGASLSFTDFKASDKVYKQIIKPYMMGRGIHKIDVIFISHNDLDHNGSVDFIVEDMIVDEIIVHDYYDGDEQLLTKWQNEGVQITKVSFNERINRFGQEFRVVSPRMDNKDDNENSLVLYTKFGQMSWLFTGDIGKGTERKIIGNYQDLRVDVLKVGHHGSNTSTDPQFLDTIRPTYALISVGRNNRYGHPTNEVVETLVNRETIIYRTDEQGAIQYHFQPNKGSFKTFLKND